MITLSFSVLLLVVVLAAFVAVGVRGNAASGEDAGGPVDEYVVARNTQRTGSLALSFLASGLGAWILFAPPELGALLGIDGVIGYALAAGAPFLVFAFVGPRLRRTVPSGQGLTEFIHVRFGATAGVAVALLSVLYMGVFVAAELLAVAGIGELLGGIPRWLTIGAVTVATLAYTTAGGIRASLRTDRWQSWLVIALIVIAAAAALTAFGDAVATLPSTGLLGVDAVGVETGATLLIAVTAANLFHHGYWQRVWAAADERTLRRGALIGGALTVPVVLVAGAFGVVAAAAGVAEVPALSVFALTGALPTMVVAAVLVLGIALVASSVDTLENGLAALLVTARPRTPLRTTRAVTVVVMVPAVAVALTAGSVLQLLLVADLLCAALVVPTLLGLWRRTTTAGVLAGGAAGLAGAYAAAWYATGSAGAATAAVTFADVVPTLPPFLGAVVASAVIAVVVSLVTGHAPDLGSMDVEVRARRGAASPAAR